MIVINSGRVAIDLLEKRGAIYSDRPHFPMACDLAGYGQIVSLMPYGPESRLHRKLLHKHLGSNAEIEKLVPILEYENYRFLQRVINIPENLLGHIRMLATRL